MFFFLYTAYAEQTLKCMGNSPHYREDKLNGLVFDCYSYRGKLLCKESLFFPLRVPPLTMEAIFSWSKYRKYHSAILTLHLHVFLPFCKTRTLS